MWHSHPSEVGGQSPVLAGAVGAEINGCLVSLSWSLCPGPGWGGKGRGRVMKPWQEGKGGRDGGMGKQGDEGGRGFLPGLQERSRCQRIWEEGVPCSRLASLNPGDVPAR